jgi:hypothetical protein
MHKNLSYLRRVDFTRSFLHYLTFLSGIAQKHPNLARGVLLSVAILVAPFTGFGNNVTCANGASDASLIQNAVNAGGTVNISGTCAIGTSIIINNAVTINGPATLNGSVSSIFNVGGNSVTINGLTFNGTTAVAVFGTDGSVNQHFTFTNNTVQNTNGNTGLVLGSIMQYAAINNNTFYNIAPNGFSSFVFNGSCYSSASGCDLPGTGIAGLSGWDNSTIQYNTFDLIANDGIHIAWNDISQDRYYFPTSNVSVSYNTFTRVHRISLEAQGTTNYQGCNSGNAGACTDGNHIYSSNFKVAGNYTHNVFQSYVNTYAFSLPTSNDQMYINNSAIAENPNITNNSSLAYAQETAGHNTLVQGNVYASDYFKAQNPHGWSNGILFGGSSPLGGVATVENNYLCMDQESTTDFNQENPTSNFYTAQIQYNFRANSCPNTGHLTTSSIAVNYLNSSTAGSNVTFNFGVVSTLSIRYLQFYIDGASTPAGTQEVSDISSTFATDTRWLYHFVVNTGSLTAGAHSVKAVATDVSGASKSVTQSFNVGSAASGAPVAQLSSTSASFGSETLGLASSAQVITISNTGTAAMSISSVSLNSTNNVTDFSPTSNCSTTLAASASCTVSIVFTPTVTGSESATLLVSDNAAGSPQSVTLTGVGVSPSGSPGALATASTSAPSATAATTPAAPTNIPAVAAPTATAASTLPNTLPAGMILWLANDVGVETTSSGGVSAWRDQSGNGNDALQSSAGNQPTVEQCICNGQENALHFDGQRSYLKIASLPIAGLTSMTVFIVSSNSQDEPNAGYGDYAVLSWPETSEWGYTFFGTYQTLSHFRFGTTQVGNENTVALPSNVGTSFVLGEWMHNSSNDYMWLNERSVGYYQGELPTIAGVGNTAFLGFGDNDTFFPGDVAEVIVYGRALNTGERRAVESYLTVKYQTPSASLPIGTKDKSSSQ